MHGHARAWRRPPEFTRKLWSVETSIGERPHWGRWRDGLGLDAPGEALIGRTVDVIRSRLDRYGTSHERFGVVHADLRPVAAEAAPAAPSSDHRWEWWIGALLLLGAAALTLITTRLRGNP